MRRFEAVLAVSGLAIFAAVASRMNWAVLVRQLEAAALGLPLLIAISLTRLGLQTRSWRCALAEENIRIGFCELAGIRLSSQAMGYLSVFGPALSEPMKIGLLRKETTASTTATLVDSGIYWFSSGSFAVFACVCLGIAFAGSRHEISLMVLALAFASAVAFLAGRRSFLATLTNLLKHRTPSWIRRGAQIEDAIRGFRVTHPETARTMLRISICCQLLLLAEALVVLYSIGFHLNLSLLLGVELASRIVKLAAGWLPARIGADEGGAAAAFAAFGFSPTAGLVLAFSRRFRDLLWCAAGLGWLAYRSRGASLRSL